MRTLTESVEKRLGVARVINKAGHCSRSAAEALVREHRVQVNHTIITDPEYPTKSSDIIIIDGTILQTQTFVYLMLNKPRGLVTTANDEQGRDTVYQCLQGLGYPHLGPVGRLDKASEGLLLFTNDTLWANGLLDPARKVSKTYHVQVDGVLTPAQLEQMKQGVLHQGTMLQAQDAQILRLGERNSWLEIRLQEGKNREIRRMLEVFGFTTLRLLRVAIGSLVLGDLPKGAVRKLTEQEIRFSQ